MISDAESEFDTFEEYIDHLLIRIELYSQLARGCGRLSIKYAARGDLPEARKWGRRTHQRLARLISLTRRLDELTGA